MRCIGVFLWLFVSLTAGRAPEFSGELSGSIRTVDPRTKPRPVSMGVRYLPAYHLESSSYPIDVQISGNVWTLYDLNSKRPIAGASSYRVWARLTSPSFEFRAGLQKISFGPAKLLRSLMWFDRLDPQDLLQLAEGVYGLRLWYVFPNNANVWVWGLYGNKGTKGIETMSTREESPEIGGRFQYPVGSGEMAVSTHSRLIELGDERKTERRIALDGVWDLGMGILFESALVRTGLGHSGPDWQTFVTTGADYTFGVGNGLTVLGEHRFLGLDDVPFGTESERHMSGLTIAYPVGLMDQLSYFGFYAWYIGLPYHYLSWQRNYPAWIAHLSAFWSTGTGGLARENGAIAGLGRKGVQFMIIFNH